MNREPFDRLARLFQDVSKLGMEVCVTLGELGPEEAVRLKEAGKATEIVAVSCGPAAGISTEATDSR